VQLEDGEILCCAQQYDFHSIYLRSSPVQRLGKNSSEVALEINGNANINTGETNLTEEVPVSYTRNSNPHLFLDTTFVGSRQAESTPYTALNYSENRDQPVEPTHRFESQN